MIEHQNFLAYLKKNHPYLYKTELVIEKIKKETGFGEASISLRVRDNRVDKISVMLNFDEIIQKRKDDVFI